MISDKEIYCRKCLCGVEFMYNKCYVTIGMGRDGDRKWATIYSVESNIPNKGYCQALLEWLKKEYESKGFEFGSSVALNDKMRYILKKLNIKEYRYGNE